MTRDTQERRAFDYLREVGAKVLEVTRKRHVKIRWRRGSRATRHEATPIETEGGARCLVLIPQRGICVMARDTQASAVFDYLNKVGANIDSVTHNRHIKIKWTLNGRKGITVVGTSGAGEARKVKNMMAKLKRDIRRSQERPEP